MSSSVFNAPLQKTVKRLKPTSNYTLTGSYPTLATLPVAVPTSASDYPVISVNADGMGLLPNIVKFIPYGTGADNATFTILVVGFTHILTDANASAVEWVPQPIAELTCTLSSFVGVSGSTITDSDRFVDTIAIASVGNSNVDVVISSNALNYPASFSVDCKSCEYIGLLMKGGTATTSNALYQMLN